MKIPTLDKIGFYTLSDNRAIKSNGNLPLARCELILTDKCNFKCKYCRGLRFRGDMSPQAASRILEYWINDGMINVRFSGGEPTSWEGLENLATQCKKSRVKRIAVSTNGSASLSYYKNLVKCGVNDFSISLDACCAATNGRITGAKESAWNIIIDNIKELPKITYVTVGIVINEINIEEALSTVLFAHKLGVSDIRIIPSAQYNKLLGFATEIPDFITHKYPILKYRVNNIRKSKNVRGIGATDTNKCGLVLDDMAVAGNYHFPCVIYLREGGEPIGRVGSGMRKERAEWYKSHNTHKDSICSKNCLDVCIDFNNKREVV